MHHTHTAFKRLIAAALLLTLAGCGVTDRIGKRMEDSWAADMLADSEKVILTSDGGNQLNPDAEGKPLSVVMRVYQLTDLERFAATDAETLWDTPQKALGNTLVEAREITLLPRHWDWLAAQPGGASVALRRLVEDARKVSSGDDRRRAALAGGGRRSETA